MNNRAGEESAQLWAEAQSTLTQAFGNRRSRGAAAAMGNGTKSSRNSPALSGSSYEWTRTGRLVGEAERHWTGFGSFHPCRVSDGLGIGTVPAGVCTAAKIVLNECGGASTPAEEDGGSAPASIRSAHLENDAVDVRRKLGQRWGLGDRASVRQSRRVAQPAGFEGLYPRWPAARYGL